MRNCCCRNENPYRFISEWVFFKQEAAEDGKKRCNSTKSEKWLKQSIHTVQIDVLVRFHKKPSIQCQCQLRPQHFSTNAY